MGFEKDNYGKYIDGNNNPISSTSTTRTGSVGEKAATFFILPKVLEKAKNHFNCSSLTGLELSDSGDTSFWY